MRLLSFYRTLVLSICFSASVIIALTSVSAVASTELAKTIKTVSPSVVGIGLMTPLNARAAQLRGTGFVFSNGQYVATNYHVVSEVLDPTIVQYYAVLSGSGKRPDVLRAEIVATDPLHDIAILQVTKTLPALTLAGDDYYEAGLDIALTGFPIGAVLGLYPATHTGIIAGVTPDSTPARSSDQLTQTIIERLSKAFLVYQLDATAYPGNSGSPLYLQDSGVVIGIINKVFVTEGKESALTNPSGITYAIPIRHLKRLAEKQQISW
jgi:S1-C subfamily serine protease